MGVSIGCFAGSLQWLLNIFPGVCMPYDTFGVLTAFGFTPKSATLVRLWDLLTLSGLGFQV